MKIKLFRNLLSGGFEVVVAVVLALIFFGAFLTFLNTIFPYGTGLSNLAHREGKNSGGKVAGQHSDFLIESGRGGMDLGRAGILAAKLTDTTNSVKSKRADGISWEAARNGMDLYVQDAVQTFSKSNAVITFDKKNYLEMGENSIVIIRQLEQDPFLDEKRTFLVIVDGELSGKVAATGGKMVNLEVATPGGIAKIRTKEGTKGDTEFKIKVNPDKSSTLSVFNGFAEMFAEGKTIRVGKNQAVTVIPGKMPQMAKQLPGAPLLVSPRNAGHFYYRDLPPKIRFTWKSKQRNRKYHFMLARDRGFKDVIVDEYLSERYFTHGNLKEGRYYWKVSALSNWSEGKFSKVRRINFTLDKKPPLLKVDFPPEVVKEKSFILKGLTDPGAEIFVDGKLIPISNRGEFEYYLQLKQGVNVVVIEAIDKAGNVTFNSTIVNRKI